MLSSEIKTFFKHFIKEFKKREKINFDRYTFTIEALDRKRIKQLKVTRNHE